MSESESCSSELSDLIDALASRLSETGVAPSRGSMVPQDLARECLRTIANSGFELRASSLNSSSAVQSSAAVAAINELQNAGKLRLRDLLSLRRQCSGPDALATESADGVIYAGINAATTALLLNDADIAVTIAKQVTQICVSKPDFQSDYWSMATLGECDLINGRLEDAKVHYSAAVQLAGSNYADIASTRRNAAILLDHLKLDADVLADWFPIPSVAIFTGHLMDRPGAEPRFPHERLDSVRSQIVAWLDENRVGFGYSAAANGGDLLFLEAIDQRRGESHIVLPLAKELFVQLSVAVDPSHDWEREFDKAMDRAAHVLVVNDFSRTGDALQFEYANQVMTGLALLHASEAFAAVAAAENVTGFRCDYVGVTPMAKGYGDFPTYHVRRVKK